MGDGSWSVTTKAQEPTHKKRKRGQRNHELVTPETWGSQELLQPGPISQWGPNESLCLKKARWTISQEGCLTLTSDLYTHDPHTAHACTKASLNEKSRNRMVSIKCPYTRPTCQIYCVLIPGLMKFLHSLHLGPEKSPHPMYGLWYKSTNQTFSEIVESSSAYT